MNMRSSSSVEVSIVIPTFNRKEILFYCLKALVNQTFSKDKFEVLLVDDGSNEDIESLVNHFSKDIHIHYIRQEKSGQAKAINLGIMHSQSNIILFLDNDMISTPELVEEHVKYHKIYKNYIVKGAYANTSNYKDPASASEFRFYSTAFFIAGNVSISKEILLNVGMFDEDFNEYGWLDLELGIRLRKMGIGGITNPKAFSYHYQKSFELEDFPGLCLKEIERGHMAVLFYSKHPCFRVKMATMNPVIMLLGNLSYKYNLTDNNKYIKVISFLYENNMKAILKHLINLIALIYYSYGVKEALAI